MSTLPTDPQQVPGSETGLRVLFKVSLLVIGPLVGLYLLRLALMAMGVINQ